MTFQPNSSQQEVVVVAGGTGGLGRAVSLAFLEQGARVIVYLCSDVAAVIHGAAIPVYGEN